MKKYLLVLLVVCLAQSAPLSADTKKLDTASGADIPQAIAKQLTTLRSAYQRGEKTGDMKDHGKAALDMLLLMRKASLAPFSKQHSQLMAALLSDGTNPHLSWIIQYAWQLHQTSKISKDSRVNYASLQKSYGMARAKDKKGKNATYVFIAEKRSFGEGYRPYSEKVGKAVAGAILSPIAAQVAASAKSPDAFVRLLQYDANCKNVVARLPALRGREGTRNAAMKKHCDEMKQNLDRMMGKEDRESMGAAGGDIGMGLPSAGSKLCMVMPDSASRQFIQQVTAFGQCVQSFTATLAGGEASAMDDEGGSSSGGSYGDGQDCSSSTTGQLCTENSDTGGKTCTKDAGGSCRGGQVTITEEYNAEGQLVSSTTTNENIGITTPSEQTTYDYDGDGNLTRSSHYEYFGNGDGTYDRNLTNITMYDANGKISGMVTNYYDDEGNKTAQLQENPKTGDYFYTSKTSTVKSVSEKDGVCEVNGNITHCSVASKTVKSEIRKQPKNSTPNPDDVSDDFDGCEGMLPGTEQAEAMGDVIASRLGKYMQPNFDDRSGGSAYEECFGEGEPVTEDDCSTVSCRDGFVLDPGAAGCCRLDPGRGEGTPTNDSRCATMRCDDGMTCVAGECQGTMGDGSILTLPARGGGILPGSGVGGNPAPGGPDPSPTNPAGGNRL